MVAAGGRWQCVRSDGRKTELVLAGNFSQIKFARSSWRETFLKLNSPATRDRQKSTSNRAGRRKVDDI
jgi:hypothetical protein